MRISVIGGGLAGCEAAWQAAERGADVKLYEMKPLKYSPAHQSANMCELICSNSLKAERIQSAGGLLKKEMEHFSSVVCSSAYETRVPAGGALAVDRELFALEVTNRIKSHKRIEVINKEVTKIPRDEIVIVAPGPLVSGELAEDIKSLASGYLSFYDAAAPIVEKDTIDFDSAFLGARYGRGGDDYINCPMTEDEYSEFY